MLREAGQIELLITSVLFPGGTPHGVSLALMARTKRPGIKVLFVGKDELRKHTEGIGELLPLETEVSKLLDRAGFLLSGGELTS